MSVTFALTDTERRRFQEWYAKDEGRQYVVNGCADQFKPDFSGHWVRCADGATRWIYFDRHLQSLWRGWQAALTFRTLENL